MAAKTRLASFLLTDGTRFIVRETVAMETLARRATSRMSSVFFFLVDRARRGEFVIVMASGLELLQPA
jgi:hypothetical protein